MKNLWITLAITAIVSVGGAAAEEAPAAGRGRQAAHHNEVFATFQADRLEQRWRNGDDVFLWDVSAWIGGDFHKLYVESEGEAVIGEDVERAGAEIFYNRTISTFWDLQLGIRHDFEPRPSRTFAAFGIQGLAPYWFEVDATAYLSEDGDVSVAVEAGYDLLLSQRLILRPRFEIAAALQEVAEYGVGSGVNGVELGVRLRYEIRRKFAPYVGVSWHRLIGDTADFSESEGEAVDSISWIAGVKLWF